jgi:hypothetical protein
MTTMGSRRVAFSLVVLTVGLGDCFACTNYEPPDVANYGPPNGLSQKVANAPPSDGGAGSSSGGSTGDSGTPGASNVACVTAGGSIVSDAGCSVSWSKDLFPKFQSGGAWNCAGSSCHGGASTPPTLTGDAHAFYTTLANYKGTVTSGTQAGQTYFNPCSTDPGQSTFVCNLKPTGYCGSLGMPLGITVANPGPIATWVACGAPEN